MLTLCGRFYDNVLLLFLASIKEWLKIDWRAYVHLKLDWIQSMESVI